MMFKKWIFFLIILFTGTCVSLAKEQAPQESDQQINDFSLAGYGEKGKKTWELSGKSADIFTDVVKLKDITGNLYGDEKIKLTSDKGDFNKAEGKIHLEKNVVITTETGAKLTTNSLDWDRKKQFVSTKDIVNIERENMITQALGASGNPSLKQVNLEKDVTVELKPEVKANGESSAEDKVVVTCDGPLEVDYEKNIAIFKNNVKVDRDNSQIYCDIMNIYFLKSGQAKEKEEKPADPSKPAAFMGNTKIDKLVCRGNVRIIRGNNTSYSDEAIYSALDKKITLSGRPKLILYSEGLKDAPLGN